MSCLTEMGKSHLGDGMVVTVHISHQMFHHHPYDIMNHGPQSRVHYSGEDMLAPKVGTQVP